MPVPQGMRLEGPMGAQRMVPTDALRRPQPTEPETATLKHPIGLLDTTKRLPLGAVQDSAGHAWDVMATFGHEEQEGVVASVVRNTEPPHEGESQWALVGGDGQGAPAESFTGLDPFGNKSTDMKFEEGGGVSVGYDPTRDTLHLGPYPLNYAGNEGLTVTTPIFPPQPQAGQ